MSSEDSRDTEDFRNDSFE